MKRRISGMEEDGLPSDLHTVSCPSWLAEFRQWSISLRMVIVKNRVCVPHVRLTSGPDGRAGEKREIQPDQAAGRNRKKTGCRELSAKDTEKNLQTGICRVMRRKHVSQTGIRVFCLDTVLLVCQSDGHGTAAVCETGAIMESGRNPEGFRKYQKCLRVQCKQCAPASVLHKDRT